MSRYEYATVPMQVDTEKNRGLIRWKKGAPESTLDEVLGEYADQGWRYVGFVPLTYNSSYPSSRLIFERERS